MASEQSSPRTKGKPTDQPQKPTKSKLILPYLSDSENIYDKETDANNNLKLFNSDNMTKWLSTAFALITAGLGAKDVLYQKLILPYTQPININVLAEVSEINPPKAEDKNANRKVIIKTIAKNLGPNKVYFLKPHWIIYGHMDGEEANESFYVPGEKLKEIKYALDASKTAASRINIEAIEAQKSKSKFFLGMGPLFNTIDLYPQSEIKDNRVVIIPNNNQMRYLEVVINIPTLSQSSILETKWWIRWVGCLNESSRMPDCDVAGINVEPKSIQINLNQESNAILTISLKSKPNKPVSISIDKNGKSLNFDPVIFTSKNWYTLQTKSIKSIKNKDIISLISTNSEDETYRKLGPTKIIVTNQSKSDNENPASYNWYNFYCEDLPFDHNSSSKLPTTEDLLNTYAIKRYKKKDIDIEKKPIYITEHQYCSPNTLGLGSDEAARIGARVITVTHEVPLDIKKESAKN
jgi:hypothetical protein